MSSGSGLPANFHAPFAVISRLLSCLVTEKLLRAFYIPIPEQDQIAGIVVVLSTHVISEKPVLDRVLHRDDIFVIVPLRHSPVFNGKHISRHGRSVGLLDPLDMAPQVYQFVDSGSHRTDMDKLQRKILQSLVFPGWDIAGCVTLRQTSDPVVLFKKFVDGVVIQDSLREVIEKELSSSLEWQLAAYRNPPRCPFLQSPPIEWEQSLVAGHPTHPMHRARMFLNTSHDFDWYHPRIRFARVPRSSVDLLGPFDDLTRHLVELAATRAGYSIPLDRESIFVPVHELQVENIIERFHDVELLHPDINLPALAQSSIRTVILSDLPGMALKLAVGVTISSALRTISHFTANFGPRFSSEIIPKLAIDPLILSVELEPASVVYRFGNPSSIKHFSALVRAEYQPAENETLIVCAALLETDHADVPAGVAAVRHVFELDTDEKRVQFLDRYIQLACDGLLPPLIHNGVAFEAHAQNVLARFDAVSGELLGFVIRDLGGLRIHPGTLQESTGINFQFLPGHCVITNTVEETYPKFYHTFVHNHIQRLIRLLDLHYDGRGWKILRKHMHRLIPRDHGLWKAWLDPEQSTVPSKCLMRMRMRDSYNEMVYCPYPNMIQYRPAPMEEEGNGLESDCDRV